MEGEGLRGKFGSCLIPNMYGSHPSQTVNGSPSEGKANKCVVSTMSKDKMALLLTFILKGINNIDYKCLIILSSSQAISNGWKLKLKMFNASHCGIFLSYDTASSWNRLPAEVVNNMTIGQFKNRLDNLINTLIQVYYILQVSPKMDYKLF